MLFLVFFITAFAAVVNGNLLGVSYYFDENYFNTFSDKQCVNSTQWDLVSYDHLDVVPPAERGSSSIRSSRNSCTSSFPIVFLNGTVELAVYLRTVSKYSGITISVFDENDEAMVSVRYRRSNRNFVPGWGLILVPIQKHTTGYVQISGQSLYSELVIVDSLRYIPDNSTRVQNDEKTQAILSDQIKSSKTTNELKDANKLVPTNFLFNENGKSVDEISEDDIEGSGEDETDEDPDENPEQPGSETNTEDPDENPEEPGSETDTEDPDENPEEPGSETDTEEPSPEGDTDSPNPEGNGFWNAFTISFVAVGAFFVVGVVGVGAYYIGKNQGTSQSPPVDLESIEPRRIIPRARSVFSDATPYESFSRYS